MGILGEAQPSGLGFAFALAFALGVGFAFLSETKKSSLTSSLTSSLKSQMQSSCHPELLVPSPERKGHEFERGRCDGFGVFAPKFYVWECCLENCVGKFVAHISLLFSAP